jgi:hypothetical protein
MNLPRSMFLSTSFRDVVIGRRFGSSYEERRIVVTGLGGVTPLGVNIATSWQGLLDGKCAIGKIDTNMDDEEKPFLPIYESLPSKIAARIPLREFLELREKHFSTSDARVMSKAMMLGVLAADEALQDAGKNLNVNTRKFVPSSPVWDTIFVRGTYCVFTRVLQGHI